MSRKMQKRATFLLFFLFFLMSVIPVFANDDVRWYSIRVPQSDRAAVQALFDGLNNGELRLEPSRNSRETNIGVFAQYDGDGTIQLNLSGYANASEKSRKEVVKTFVNALKESRVSDNTQQQIMNDMGAADKDISSMLIPLIFDSTNADLFTAYKWLSPFLGVVRLILGILSIGVIIIMFFSTVIDLAYIGLPILRDIGTGGHGGQEKKPFGVSFEALATVKEIESSIGGGGGSNGGYRNAYFLYFKRRSVTYIVLAICILYLVVGELGGLMAWLMSLGSGIVG